MKIITAAIKGGNGKSFLAKILSLKADKEGTKTYFIDCDSASASSTKFFKGIEDRKSPHILFRSEDLQGPDRKIDRTKFDSFLTTLEKLDNVVADLGGATSQQLLFYIQEEKDNHIIETLRDLGIRIYLVMAGGGSIKESVDFALELKKIEGINDLITVVANEYHGGVNGKSVKAYTNADIQINSLHEDVNSEAQREWNDLMNGGVVYSDIMSMPVIRRRRIVSYLDGIFAQIDAANEHA